MGGSSDRLLAVNFPSVVAGLRVDVSGQNVSNTDYPTHLSSNGALPELNPPPESAGSVPFDRPHITPQQVYTMAVLSVGQPAPDFCLPSISLDQTQAREVRLDDYRGRWLMLFFYPRDFSFVCPTELTTFSATIDDFEQRECDILAVSVDSISLHQEWISTPPEEGGLGPLQFPLGSDADGAVARAYGVWVPEKEVSTRGVFLIDPGGILQYAVIHNLSVGRTPDEVLRVLDALRTGGLCPASWTAADGTIDLESALEPGRILGHYRIRKRLGGGAFGSVFAAWDLRLERMVALKVLRHNLLESRAATVNEAAPQLA